MSDSRRANSLDGKTWTRYSVSVWSDIRRTPEERSLKHPALFPIALARRVIECFLPPTGSLVVDPFCGVGSTVLAACELGREGVGLDINPKYVEKARRRLEALEKAVGGNGHHGSSPAADFAGQAARPTRGRVICADALDIGKHVKRASADLVVTSPPYWNILTRRRSADRKAVRNYGDDPADLGRIDDYDQFLRALATVFRRVKAALRPGAYCVVVVMDLRKGNQFYPFHADLARAMTKIGFLLDDIIIWDRRQEYNLFRPLGYPYVFRVNKAHEFVMVFQKPKAADTPPRK